MGHTSPAAVGVQPAHEHLGPVCAPAGGLGGGEDGSLPPDLRAGITFYSQKIPDQRALLSNIKEPFYLFVGFELPHTLTGPDPLCAKSQRDCHWCPGAVCSISWYVSIMSSQACVTWFSRHFEWVCLVFTDNVTLQIDGVLYLRILDPFKVCCKEPEVLDWSSSPVCLYPLIKVTGMSFLSPHKLFPGQLRCGGSRVCRHTAGTDHHALGAGQAHTGQSVQGNDCFFSSRCSVGSLRKHSWCLNLFFLRKGSPSTPTSFTPSTKLQMIGGSAASDTKSKIYTFRRVSKSLCRCRWAQQNENIAGLI